MKLYTARGSMKEGKLRKTLLQITMLAALMFVTYYLIMRDKDITQVWAVVVASSKCWLLAAAAVMAVYVFCGGWAIKVMMKGRGRKVTIWQCFKYSFVEIYFSAITPSNTGGQPVQMVYMREDGFPVSESTVVLCGVTVLYRVAFLITCGVLFLINLDFISGPISSVWPLVILGVVVNLALIGALILLLFSKKLLRWIMEKTVKLLGKLHIVKDVPEKLASFSKKIEQYHSCAKFFAENKGLVVRTFLVLALQRAALMSVPCFVYLAFGLKGYSFIEIMTTQYLLSLCVDLMPLPGAVGISETVFLMMFTPIFLEANITSAVLLSRGISFYLLVVIAGLVIIGLQVAKIFKKSDDAGAKKIKSASAEAGKATDAATEATEANEANGEEGKSN